MWEERLIQAIVVALAFLIVGSTIVGALRGVRLRRGLYVAPLLLLVLFLVLWMLQPECVDFLEAPCEQNWATHASGAAFLLFIIVSATALIRGDDPQGDAPSRAESSFGVGVVGLVAVLWVAFAIWAALYLWRWPL